MFPATSVSVMLFFILCVRFSNSEGTYFACRRPSHPLLLHLFRNCAKSGRTAGPENEARRANRPFPALSVAGGNRWGKGRFAGGRAVRNDLGLCSQRREQPPRQFSSFRGAAVAQRPSEDSCGSERVTLQWRF